MSPGPLVSVVMPAYNTSRYIKQAIDSIVQQTHTNWELLICDDASTDSTLTCITSYQDPRIKVFSNKSNLGYLKTTNSILSKCTGNFITFQDSDDFSHVQRIEKQLEAFQLDQEIAICGTNGFRVNRYNKPGRPFSKAVTYEQILDTICERNPFIGSSLMIKREVYEVVGGFREYFDDLAYQDYDWAWLIVEKFKGINLKGKYYYYRQHSTSNSKKVNLKRHVSNRLVQHLAKQRQQTGSDDVFGMNVKQLDAFMNLIQSPYLEYPSRMYREYAEEFLFAKLYSRALRMSLLAIWNNPTSTKEYKLLANCLWRYIIDK